LPLTSIGTLDAPILVQPLRDKRKEGGIMQQRIKSLITNDLFLLFLNGVLAHTCFVALVIYVMQVPPEVILDSGLKEILMVFEG
jgi:hypothetical protein